MKCKDCNSMCKYRSSDAERECYYSQSQPDTLSAELKTNEEKHWQDVRERAAIAAMQSIISSNVSSLCYDHEFVTRDAIRFADTLVKQLRGE